MKNPKNILITGASSGIGAALALHYAQAGISLFISGRNEDPLQEVADQCRAKGAEVESALVDVTHQKEMENWIIQANEDIPLDLVIANAGIASKGEYDSGKLLDLTRKVFDVNVTGVFNTIEPALEIFKTRDDPCQIAIVSSLAGYRGWASAPAYTASKGAVRFYGEALRGSLKETPIQVNVICPGFVRSRITDENEFKMPFFMEADKAAKIICQGLEKNKGRIAFPWPMNFAVWLISVLPDCLAQKLVQEMPAKEALIK
ncbi:MAG: SDR family NAD(P)-dependent oxidoreductase [Pseudomonadota bacterium]